MDTRHWCRFVGTLRKVSANRAALHLFLRVFIVITAMERTFCLVLLCSVWFVYLGAVLCGIGASLFWAAEGAIAVGYPSEAQRGRMVGIWLAIRNIGPLISGIISVVLNTGGSGVGKVSYTTYYALIAIQCLGLPVSLLLSPPDKVIRPDGTRIPHLKRSRTSIKREIVSVWHIIKAPQFALLIPIFIAGTWGSVYQSNYLTAYFSVRARALASLLTAIVQLAADFIFAFFSDYRGFGNQRRRTQILWVGFAVGITGLWIWQIVTEVFFTRTNATVDWNGSSSSFNNAMAVLILWKYVSPLTIRFFYEAQLGFVYWILGTYPHSDGTMERAVGLLRTFESIGTCMSYVVGTTHWANLNQCILSASLWALCLIPTTLAVQRVPSTKIELSDEQLAEMTQAPTGDTSRTDSRMLWEKEASALSDMNDFETLPTLSHGNSK